MPAAPSPIELPADDPELLDVLALLDDLDVEVVSIDLIEVDGYQRTDREADWELAMVLGLDLDDRNPF